MEMHKARTTEEARKALSSFCKAVGTHGDKYVHIFSIPVDEERDADCVLSDVILDRDALLKVVERLMSHEAFGTPFALSDSFADDELRARMKFAKDALEVRKK